MKLEIAEARSEIMAPLSAASMESYSRAYPYLVKLHMLQVCPLLFLCGGFNMMYSLLRTEYCELQGATASIAEVYKFG